MRLIVEKRRKMEELIATEQVLEKVKIAFHNVKTGILTKEELEDLVINTHALYERAIILRYKAYEAKVFGKDINSDSTKTEKIEIKTEKIIVSEAKIESKLEPEVQVLNNPSPTIDFSIFDDLEPVDSKKIPEEIKIEVKTVEKSLETPAQVSIFEEVETVSSHVDLFKKIKQMSDAPSINAKLNSLVGAFGFAQKLQIVNELFGGSQFAFSAFVEEADAIETKDGANAFLHKSIQHHKMSIDGDAFSQLVLTYERKYV
jgi:hypothetical protein